MYFPYKFKYGDKVNIVSYIGATIPATVVCNYTSTEYGHPAEPHFRYVVLLDYVGDRTVKETMSTRLLDNVAECELEFQVGNSAF